MSSPPTCSSLDAVSAGVYSALNVSSLLALAPGGVGDDIPQGALFPFVLYDVAETPFAQLRGRPGTGRTLEIALRLYIYSQYAGMRQAQLIADECISLLSQPLTVSGFEASPVMHDETVPVGRDLIAGVVVNELVVNLRLFVTETP